MAGKISAPGHGGGKRGRLEVTADPNVIPFIDVMLVLLIIFMIAAPIATVDIQVDMPDARIPTSKRPPKPTWISLQDKDGVTSLFVMNDAVSLEQLGEKTYDAVRINSPNTNGDEELILKERIFIRAEGGTRYRNVLRVMNTLNARGFTKVALVAEDKSGFGGPK
jgi:biopolymer transport protein ExbD